MTTKSCNPPALPCGTGAGKCRGTWIDKVTYGPGDTEFTADDCYISSDTHDQITCFTTNVGGAGKSLKWQLTLDGLVSETASTNYGIPSITAISGAGATDAATDGGELVTITGTSPS